LARLRRKAAAYAQDFEGGGEKIDIEGVVDLYESFIIPLTKQVEVRLFLLPTIDLSEDVQIDYLLRRLDGLTPEEISELS
jgi:chorismate mutase